MGLMVRECNSRRRVAFESWSGILEGRSVPHPPDCCRRVARC